MKTATFSNGFKDEYKGKRDVKAAWAIIEINNNRVIASGHSMTPKAADSTSKSHYSLKKHHFIKPDGVMKELANKSGLSVNELMRKQKEENSEYRKKFKIEIVSL